MSLFISSGEVSGDHYTANLARALRESGYSEDLWGMGGVESREAGVCVEWPGERLQLFGITEVLSSIPSVLVLMREMVERIIKLNPECVIVADSPDFHMHLIAKLRRRGYLGRVFYISPPTVWAWRSSRVNNLRATVDECLPLFKFEHDYLLSRGCPSFWMGHPLLEEFSSEKRVSEDIFNKFGDDKRLVAFLPGSRKSEIDNLLPIMEKAAAELMKLGWHPVFSVAPGLDDVSRSKIVDSMKENLFDYYDGPGRDLIAAANCSIGASGTITVESMLLGCYMVVTYKVNPITAFIAKCIVKTRYFAMANILVGSEVFPELLQERVTSQNIVEHSLAWLDGNESYRQAILEMMRCGSRMLGEHGVYLAWAGRIMEAASDVQSK